MLVRRPEQVSMPGNAAGEGRISTAPVIHDLVGVLRETRRELGITQLDLSRQLRVTEITVTDWEARRDVPTTGNFYRWVEALGYVVEIRASSSGEPLMDSVPSSKTRNVEARMRRISRMLKQARVESGLTQEELGVELGVSTWTIRMWESVQRTPRLMHLVAWCEVFGCQLALATPE